ncbi:ras association domain-containing protein 8 [Trichomycterus rosablanca]|uniref:ras association domain-containing protein 8 n=1 Tax=Trichomycterus rosablanca TaxID=2290929 RepID=UPI002F351179
MEIKVSIEKVQRIVCGVTEKTTCKEVVIALAQALGRSGRYTLREQFKGYERYVTPDELLLESLAKYGEQSREVQLNLHYLGPSVMDSPNKPRVQLRRAEGGGKMRMSSAGSIFHRQSLPPLSFFQTKPLPEELKSPKRKSLTLTEEAWGWLENFGRGGRQQPGRDKSKSKQDDRQLDKKAAKIEKRAQIFGVLQGRNDETKNKNRAENQGGIIHLGKQRRIDGDESGEINKGTHKTPVKKDPEPVMSEASQQCRAFDEADKLRKVITQQQTHLKELKLKIDSTNEQICKLEMLPEEAQNAESTPELSEEEQQLKFWLNELRAEEVFEKDLQRQFLELKEKAAECKNKLEEYKSKLQCMGPMKRRLSQGEQTVKTHEEGAESAVVHLESASEKGDADKPKADSKEKTQITKVESQLPYILVTSHQITEPQLSGPAELREWWSRWTGAQKTNSTQGLVGKVIHRSEILIHLGSTRV